MVLVLLSASWMLTVVLVTGLCVAARDGDRQDDRPTHAIEPREPATP